MNFSEQRKAAAKKAEKITNAGNPSGKTSGNSLLDSQNIKKPNYMSGTNGVNVENTGYQTLTPNKAFTKQNLGILGGTSKS